MLLSRTRPGDILAGRFEIELLAGEGGMGVVYRARMRPEGEVVALKVVRTTKREERERFRREVRLLSQLNHPAIVRHIAHGELTSGESFLAMEWLDGEDLDRALAEVLALVKRVAGALADAHAQGIVHRASRSATRPERARRSARCAGSCCGARRASRILREERGSSRASRSTRALWSSRPDGSAPPAASTSSRKFLPGLRRDDLRESRGRDQRQRRGRRPLTAAR